MVREIKNKKRKKREKNIKRIANTERACQRLSTPDVGQEEERTSLPRDTPHVYRA